jgi:hypothetical protein
VGAEDRRGEGVNDNCGRVERESGGGKEGKGSGMSPPPNILLLLLPLYLRNVYTNKLARRAELELVWSCRRVFKRPYDSQPATRSGVAKLS